MINKHINITKKQEQKLKALANSTGLKEAEIIRRALDRYFEQKSSTS